ncbi:hypothetical protein GCM10011374_09060 [Kocuria dechangensis]|uniref:HTH luxR-type domain-containing protein n=1 Tax=Kocuria dechangensis TaxID=1176249 RepID=A0A917LQA3_9MICC|nr:hypothetical protein GCM10011374_09060 [Kocuria dechangensis]
MSWVTTTVAVPKRRVACTSRSTTSKALFISEATVKTHLVHIYDKLGVDNRTRAVDRARARRII